MKKSILIILVLSSQVLFSADYIWKNGNVEKKENQEIKNLNINLNNIAIKDLYNKYQNGVLDMKKNYEIIKVAFIDLDKQKKEINILKSKIQKNEEEIKWWKRYVQIKCK